MPTRLLPLVLVTVALAGCGVTETDPAGEANTAADAEAQAPARPALPATVLPVSDELPDFGIDTRQLDERDARVVKDAWQNYQRVLAGKDPACTSSFGLSDGGSIMFDCGAYDLMRVRSLAGTAERPGYEYGPSLDFRNGHKVERLRFLTYAELEQLEASPP